MSNYSDILKNFKKDLKNTFQAQKNIVDVSQKYIGMLENAEGGSGGSGLNYSETESVIGKWIDGETDVYMKVIKINDLTSGVNSIPYNIATLKVLISATVTAKIRVGTAYGWILGAYDTSANSAFNISRTDGSTNILLNAGSGYTYTGEAYLVLTYTK